MFKNRTEAGKKLAQELREYQGKNCLVLAVPRGGVVVGKEVCDFLSCPLDIISVKKLGAPGNQELGIGAVGTEKGSLFKNEALIRGLKIEPEYLEQETREKIKEAERREKVFRKNKKEIGVRDKIVIIVDDGAATGATLKAAIGEIWEKKPEKLIVALPLASKELKLELGRMVDELVILETPEPFFSVGQGYEEFEQVTDNRVMKILRN